MIFRAMFVGCVAIALTGCVSTFTKRAVPLAYAGSMSVGAPLFERSHIIIPLNYSDGQWAMNSALLPYKVSAAVVGKSIEFTVWVAVIGPGKANDGYQMMLPASLKGQGRFQLVYRDPDGRLHPLTTVEL